MHSNICQIFASVFLFSWPSSWILQVFSPFCVPAPFSAIIKHFLGRSDDVTVTLLLIVAPPSLRNDRTSSWHRRLAQSQRVRLKAASYPDVYLLSLTSHSIIYLCVRRGCPCHPERSDCGPCHLQKKKNTVFCLQNRSSNRRAEKVLM